MLYDGNASLDEAKIRGEILDGLSGHTVEIVLGEFPKELTDWI